jgi:hypothetical protein
MQRIARGDHPQRGKHSDCGEQVEQEGFKIHYQYAL